MRIHQLFYERHTEWSTMTEKKRDKLIFFRTNNNDEIRTRIAFNGTINSWPILKSVWRILKTAMLATLQHHLIKEECVSHPTSCVPFLSTERNCISIAVICKMSQQCFRHEYPWGFPLDTKVCRKKFKVAF